MSFIRELQCLFPSLFLPFWRFLSSQKKRGGLGINLALGISLAFVFVFSFEALKVVSENKSISPALAMWLPNMIFFPLAALFTLKEPISKVILLLCDRKIVVRHFQDQSRVHLFRQHF
jgi:hypothetical protein